MATGAPTPRPNRRQRKVYLQEGSLCPLCRVALDPEQEHSVVCGRCDTVYHSACINELAGGRCSVLGCAPSSRSARVEPDAAEATATEKRAAILSSASYPLVAVVIVVFVTGALNTTTLVMGAFVVVAVVLHVVARLQQEKSTGDP